jgi:hypothetical protein
VSAHTHLVYPLLIAHELVAYAVHGESVYWLVARGVLTRDAFDRFFAVDLLIMPMVALLRGRPLVRIAWTWGRGSVVKTITRTIRVAVTIIVRIVAAV